ncbi:hypothetical protein AB832_05605 [Flavobacteriaceae bacterium (ex Bugula neritina AB1)]|nr:hypothetical protein AB832_05605 [Flavobacteriaceae bacterium (ex Bugula neritina AB1)]
MQTSIDSLNFLLNQSKKLSVHYKAKESIEYAIRAANKAHELKKDKEIAYAYYYMAMNYGVIADYKSSEEYYNKALKYAELSNERNLVAGIYNGLGIVYSKGFRDLKGSLTYYLKSSEEFCKIDKKRGYILPIINIGRTYISMKEYDKAYPYLLEYEEYLSPENDKLGDCILQYLKGIYYANKENLVLAKEYFRNALKIANENNFLEELFSIYKARSEMYECIGDIENAYLDIKAYKKYQNEFLDKEQLRQIHMAKVSFNVDEYERELEIAKKEKDYQTSIASNNKVIVTISIVCLLFLLGTVFFFYIGNKSKKRLNSVLKSKNNELREAKIEAEKLAQVKSQFVSTVSHELRTPLYGVIGITSLLLEEKGIREKHKKLLGSLKFSGDYLLNLVNNVLQISKIESDKFQLKATPTNLYKLSQNLLSSFEYQARSKNNTLVFEVERKLATIWFGIDSLRLSEVLVNLVGNALKFTENGKIWLRIKVNEINKKEALLRFEIEDNGIGIPENKKEFVFNKFSQVNRELNKQEGTGLGLSIVKNILQLMDSEINLISKEGEGTTFYFDLKFNILEEGEPDTCADAKDDVAKGKGKILVVEDNKINQIVTKNLLCLLGYDCIIVEDGLRSVKVAKKEKTDLILMDLNMPFLNGYEATKLIREFDQTTPIIALTASLLDEVREECLGVGMNDLINKPLNKNDLNEIITKNVLKNGLYDKK